MSPNEAPHDSQNLAAKLAVESAAWENLLTLLETEEQALVNGEADRLAQLNAAKLAQLNTLGNLARTRQKALLAAGFSADHAGMEGWLTQQAQPQLRARWQRLCAMELEAQAANQRIGTLIELRLASTRQALNVLIHAATRQGGLYDQAGQAVAARSGKPLTAA
jgi:flagella synthesis protein FlgN